MDIDVPDMVIAKTQTKPRNLKQAAYNPKLKISWVQKFNGPSFVFSTINLLKTSRIYSGYSLYISFQQLMTQCLSSKSEKQYECTTHQILSKRDREEREKAKWKFTLQFSHLTPNVIERIEIRKQYIFRNIISNKKYVYSITYFFCKWRLAI